MKINIEGLIPLFGGVYVTLMAYKVVFFGNDPIKTEAWHHHYGKWMKIAGPLCILFGIALLFRLFSQRTSP